MNYFFHYFFFLEIQELATGKIKGFFRSDDVKCIFGRQVSKVRVELAQGPRLSASEHDEVLREFFGEAAAARGAS